MNPKHLDAIARDICNKYNYPFPRVLKLNKRLRTSWGSTSCGASHIELNEWFVLNNKKKVVEALLKHEICHTRHCNHDKEFDQAVRIMGSSMWLEDIFDDIKYLAKYVYKCPGCNGIRFATRKYKEDKSCVVCGGKEFNEKFKLKLVQELK